MFLWDTEIKKNSLDFYLTLLNNVLDLAVLKGTFRIKIITIFQGEIFNKKDFQEMHLYHINVANGFL